LAINLKDPRVAALLAWLVPGLGHFYQGRTAKGVLFSVCILGTFLYRTFFGFQLQLGDPHMGAAIATAMFAIILVGVCIYLFAIQTRLRRYQF
jgi:ABC-type sugar transport system permease subunit